MASIGPLSPNSVVNDASIGTAAWSNPSNAAASDNAYATAAVVGTPSVTNSNYLSASDFRFSVPPGSTINGVTVEIERFATGGIDRVVSLVQGGVVSGNNKASGAGWAAADPNTYVTYGANNDLWGLTLSAKDVNARAFGCVLQAGSTDTGETVSVDHMRMTVFYTLGGVGPEFSGKMTSFLAPATGDNTIVNVATANFSRLHELVLISDNTVTAVLKDEAGTTFGTYYLVASKPVRIPTFRNAGEPFIFSGDLILNLSGTVNVSGNLLFKITR